MRISDENIRRVAEALTKPLKQAQLDLKAKAEEHVTSVLTSKIPEEVVAMAVKYPQLNAWVTVYSSSISKEFDGSMEVQLPAGRNFFASSSAITDCVSKSAKAMRLIREWQASKKLTVSTGNRIKCSLTELRTYAKIRAEFPEAYSALMSLDANGGNGCDRIEKLRADLSALTPKASENK